MHTSFKNVIKFSLFSFLMVLFVNTSYAQRGNRGQGGTPEERAEKTTQRLATKLSLNENQISQVKASVHKFENARQTARTNRDRTAMKAARQTYQNELKGILTPSQYKQFEALQNKRRGRKGRRGRNG